MGRTAAPPDLTIVAEMMANAAVSSRVASVPRYRNRCAKPLVATCQDAAVQVLPRGWHLRAVWGDLLLLPSPRAHMTTKCANVPTCSYAKPRSEGADNTVCAPEMIRVFVLEEEEEEEERCFCLLDRLRML